MKETTRLSIRRNGYFPILVVCFVAAHFPIGLTAQTAPASPIYRWTTLAGKATTGYDDGAATEARFNNPHGVALDASGNVYVADTANHTIRKISSLGVVTTLAGSPNQPGSADGTGSAARFTLPEGVAVDAAGHVYVADTGNHTIRKIAPDGVVTTLAGQAGQGGRVDGPALSAQFFLPEKIFVDAAGNIYVVDQNFYLRRISLGRVETVSLAGPLTFGTGETVDVSTFGLRGPPTVDATGQIYLSVGSLTSTGPKRIIKRDPSGAYSILASSVNSDNKPFVSEGTTEVAMTTDSAGNLYFVSQLISSIVEYSLYKISPAGLMSRLNWSDLNRGGFLDAPLGLAADATGRLVHTVASDDVILQSNSQTFTVLAGIPWSNQGVDGNGAAARFSSIRGLVLDHTTNVLAADAYSYSNVHAYGGVVLIKISPMGETSTLYSGPTMERPPETPIGVALGNADTIILGSRYGSPRFRLITPNGNATTFEKGDFHGLIAMGSDSTGRLLVADNEGRVHRRSVTGEWSVLAGTSQAAEIKDGSGADAHFAQILDLSVAANGDAYVLDHVALPELRVVVRKIQSTGEVTTVSGNLVKSTDITPERLAVDAKGDLVITYNDDTVRLLSVGGAEFIIGGSSGQSGVRDGDGQTARFYMPGAITTDAQNTIFVADNAGVTVRKGEFLGYNATISSHPQSLTVATGSAAQFSVTATGTPAPTYQWQYNGTTITGATNSTLVLSKVTATNAGSYTVVVTNSLGSITSNSATLTVTPAPTPPPPASSGGGGAPSLWFLLALLSMGAVQRIQRRHG